MGGGVLRDASLGNFVLVRTSECTYTSLGGTARYTPGYMVSLQLLGYRPIEHFTIQTTSDQSRRR